MPFIAIILINALIVVGGGELTDKAVSVAKSTNKKLDLIVKKVDEKPEINVTVNPIINFKPTINVKPTVKSNNQNVNKNTLDLTNIVDGE